MAQQREAHDLVNKQKTSGFYAAGFNLHLHRLSFTGTPQHTATPMPCRTMPCYHFALLGDLRAEHCPES